MQSQDHVFRTDTRSYYHLHGAHQPHTSAKMEYTAWTIKVSGVGYTKSQARSPNKCDTGKPHLELTTLAFIILCWSTQPQQQIHQVAPCHLKWNLTRYYKRASQSPIGNTNVLNAVAWVSYWHSPILVVAGFNSLIRDAKNCMAPRKYAWICKVIYIYIYVYIDTYIFICVYIYVYLYMYTNIYVNIYISSYSYIYI